MSTKMTKQQLVDENIALRAQLEQARIHYRALRAELNELRAQCDEPSAELETPCPVGVDLNSADRYPHVDKLGRRYRIEVRSGRTVKCFPAH